MNVILITADTLRADHMGCYGYWRDTSPALDALAGEGVLFENFIGQCAHTLPSFTSMMTGLTPFQTGAVATLHCVPNTPSGKLDDETPTLAEMLAHQGVRTTAVDNLMAFACHPSWFVRGFGEYINPNPESFVTRLVAGRMNEVLAPVIERQAEPFFLWAHYWDPHRPYNQPEEYLAPFEDDPNERVQTAPDGTQYVPAWGTMEGLDTSRWRRGTQTDNDTVQGARAMINAYDGEILYLDRHLEVMFEQLRAQGLWDDTCIIFTADHGETMADHLTHFCHVEALDACTRVPLIIKPAKGMDLAPRVTRQFATHTDLAPTILDVLGAEAEGPMEGTSLLPVMRGEPGLRDHVVSTGMYLLDREDVWQSMEVSTRREQWRLVARGPLGQDYPRHGLELSQLWTVVAELYEDEPAMQLFDKTNDPDELVDVAGEHPDVVEELKDDLQPAMESPYWYQGT